MSHRQRICRTIGLAVWVVGGAAVAGCGDDGAPGDTADADAADADADGDVEAADGDADADADAEADAEPEVEDDGAGEGEAGPPRRLVVLHTNDTHSHLMGLGPEGEYSPATTGDDSTLGGAARLATLLTDLRLAAEEGGAEVLVADSGDFLMGTLFETLDRTYAPALSLFQAMGYHAITIGNHEFEWGPANLAAVVAAAAGAGFEVPILASNMVTDPADPGDDALEALVTAGAIRESAVVTLPSGLTVGFIGWMGKGAADVAPMKDPVTFTEEMETAETLAAALKSAGADVVIALSHTGLYAGALGNPTDETLAEAAPSIDVILGGHSHDALAEARTVGDTIIVQSGSYTRYLGELAVDVSDEGVSLVDWELHEIDDTIPGNEAIQEQIDAYIAAIDAGVLGAFGLSYLTGVAETTFDLETPTLVESNMGDLVTDAYRELAAAVTAADPVVAAFESDGVIRDDMLAGDHGIISVADLFRVLPLGIGPDAFPGYPLVSFWVTGAELRAGCEVSPSLSPMAGSDYFIQISGLRCHVDPDAAWLSRVDAVYLGNDEDGYSPTPIDVSPTATTLYRITVDLFVASLMSVISEYTFGGLSITPKDAAGTPVADLTTMILDGDPVTAGVQEMKLWQVLLQYVTSLPDGDGDTLPEIPARFAAAAGRYYE